MIGAEIRRIRMKLGLSQEEVAFRAKVSRNYISMLELDKKSPTLKVLFRLCKVLAVKPSELLAAIE